MREKIFNYDKLEKKILERGYNSVNDFCVKHNISRQKVKGWENSDPSLFEYANVCEKLYVGLKSLIKEKKQ